MIWNEWQRHQWAMSAELNELPNDKSRRIARLILHNLAHRADEKTLDCWPSIEELARHASASTRTIMRALPELEAAELILCGRKRRRGNMYFILISDLDEQVISDIAMSLNGGSFRSIREGISDILIRISDKTGRISDTHCHTNQEPKNQKKRINKKEKEVIKELPPWLNPEIWEAFIEHRAALKPSMTLYAQKLLIKTLDKHRDEGHDPNELLNTAIMNGWKSVVTPKSGRNGNGYKTQAEIQADNIEAMLRQTEDNNPVDQTICAFPKLGNG